MRLLTGIVYALRWNRIAVLLALLTGAVAAATPPIQPTKGSALDIPQRPWLVDAAFLARSARLGPLYGSSLAWPDAAASDHGAQPVQDSRKEPYSGPKKRCLIVILLQSMARGPTVARYCDATISFGLPLR